MKACSRLMGARSISDRRIAVAKGAGALVLALFCVLGIALVQRQGWLDGLNAGLMGMAGRARDSGAGTAVTRSEEHTSELQSLMRISYAVFCLKKKKNNKQKTTH